MGLVRQEEFFQKGFKKFFPTQSFYAVLPNFNALHYLTSRLYPSFPASPACVQTGQILHYPHTLNAKSLPMWLLELRMPLADPSDPLSHLCSPTFDPHLFDHTVLYCTFSFYPQIFLSVTRSLPSDLIMMLFLHFYSI